jgi:hypothetical protein
VQNNFRKISAIAAMLVVLSPVFFLLFLQVRQQVIRHEMKERMEMQLVQTIKVPSGEFQWIKPGKEIRTGGRLFDVKSFTEERDQYLFTGLFDEEETSLLRKLDGLCKNKDAPGQKLLWSIFQLLQSVYPGGPGTICLDTLFQKIKIHTHLAALPTCFKQILTPPPQG